MKKSLPIIIGALVVLIGVLGYVYINKGKQVNTPTEVSEEAVSDDSTSDVFTGTLKDALKLGVAMKCTYQYEGNEYEGYVKGENYRGKVTTAEGKTGEVIVKDDCIWSWSEGESQGIKTCTKDSEVEGEDGSIWDQPDNSVDTSINYRCQPTAISDSTFTPPSDIDFMDINAMMQNFGVEDTAQ